MKKFKELTKAQQKEYILLFLILPFAYIWHILSKTDLLALRRKATAICVAVLMLITTIPTVFAASTATVIRAVDNNPNLGKKTFDVTITFKTTTAASSFIASNACDNSYLMIVFPAGTTKTSVSKNGASDGAEVNNRNFYRYDVKLGKNFMTTNGDTLTITFKGLNALPFQATLILASTTISRTYKGALTITQNGSTYHTATLGGNTGNDYGTSCKDLYPTPTSSTINLSTTSVTAPLSSTSNITYTVYSNSHRGSDLADGYLLRTSEEKSWNCNGYVISEQLVYDTSDSAFSANGISLDSKNKKITIDGAAFNSAGKTCKFRIATTLVSGVQSGSTVSYLSTTVKVYSPVITVTPLNKYTVKFNANGGSGSMANQSFYWSEAKNLTANAFTYTPKVTFNENGGNAVSDASVAATFGGWEDRSTTTYGGTTYKYTDFDAPGYAIRNNDVFVSDFCNSIYDKNGLLNHYINHGKNEYAGGSTNRAPNTGYLYGYPNGAKVSNLTTTANGTVNLYAKWKYGKTTLPTPTKAGYTFKGWTGDLMDIATFTGGMEISDTSRGTIGYNANYAITENLIPVVGGTTYTSNYSICGIYSYDANGNFIKRETNRATTHTVSPNAAFVRIELITTEGISFDQYKNGLTLTYTLPVGTSFPVGGNQTLTAGWQVNSYTNRIDPNGGYRISDSSTEVVTYDKNYGDTEPISERRRTGYTLTGYKVTNSTNGSTTDLGGAVFTFDSSAKTATLKQGTVPITLTAQWSANAYTVSFNANGGSLGAASKSVTYDSTYGTLPTPTRTGYTFGGWFTAASGGTQVTSTTTVKTTADHTIYAQWTANTYTVTWKNYDGSVLETDTGVVHGTTPTYNGATPGQVEDENFTYTFDGWSPAVSAVTGDTEYIAQFAAVSKRVEPTYTVTIPTEVNEGESFTISASGVVLNTDEKLTVTLQSDFKLKNEQGAELGFKINDGAILNNAQLISVTGNGDKNNPLSLTTENLVVEIAEEAKYSGTYQGTITFTIAVSTAENN